MTHHGPNPPSGGPASWRDIYTFVEGMEGRLLQRMDEIAHAATKISDDHELRIRVLERSDIGREGGDRRQGAKETEVRAWVAIAISLLSVSILIASRLAA